MSSQECDLMEICNRNHERAVRNAKIQEAFDMANRPGERLKAERDAELKTANKRAKEAEKLNDTLLNWILLLITIGLVFCMALTWLVLRGLLPQG